MKRFNMKYLGIFALLSLLCAIVMEAIIQSLSANTTGFSFSRVLVFAVLLYAFSLVVFVLPEWNRLEPVCRYASTLWNSHLLSRPVAKLALVGLFAVLLLLQINNSSMEQYLAVLPNNIASLDFISLGTSRPIRSDEYLCSTPLFFNESYGGLSALWSDRSTPFQVVANVVSMLNPYHWGTLYLPVSIGFSWVFLIHAASYVYFFYRLFYRATGHRNASVLFGVLILLAPGLQWWWSAAMRYHCYAGIIVFFMDYFEASSWRKKVFCAWGILSCASTLLVFPYPAWDVPYAYLFLLIMVAFVLRDGIWEAMLKITRWDLLIIGVTVVLMACCALATLLGPDVAAQMETLYPGRRFDAGGNIDPLYWASGLAAPFLPWKDFTIPNSNQSEISTYLALFPIPYLIYIACFPRLKKHPVIHALMAFNVICLIYMALGIGQLLATVSLLSYTTPARISTVWALSSFLTLMLECCVLSRTPHPLPKTLGGWLALAGINLSMMAYLAWVAYTLPHVVDYIGVTLYVIMGTGLLLLLNLMYFSRSGWVLAILTCLSLASGAVVNPINLGTDIATKTPVAQAIRTIDQEEPGHWLVLNNLVMPKYVYMQGVYCPLQLSWPPQMELFEAVDETGAYEEVYNRYAHVTVILTSEDTSFVLNQADSITIYLNTDDLEKWGVDYLVLQGEPPEDTAHTTFEPLYYDELDGIQIYQIHYQ